MKLQEHVWKHISRLNDAIGEETNKDKLVKLHEELNGYLFALIFEIEGDKVKLEEELTRLKNPSILDMLNDVETHILKSLGDSTDGY